MAKYKFRLLAGEHHDKSGAHGKGAIIESDTDLAAAHGTEKYQPLSKHEEELHKLMQPQGGPAKALPTSPTAEEDKAPGPLAKPTGGFAVTPEESEHSGREDERGAEDEDDLSKLTVAQLRDHAAEHEVDLGNATRKDDIVAAIRAARE